MSGAEDRYVCVLLNRSVALAKPLCLILTFTVFTHFIQPILSEGLGCEIFVED